MITPRGNPRGLTGREGTSEEQSHLPLASAAERSEVRAEPKSEKDEERGWKETCSEFQPL